MNWTHDTVTGQPVLPSTLILKSCFHTQTLGQPSNTAESREGYTHYSSHSRALVLTPNLRPASHLRT